LICKPLLLEIGKTLRHARALNSESLGMLPGFQCVMVRHFRRIGGAEQITESFHLIPYPVYSRPPCVYSLAFAWPKQLGGSYPSHQLFQIRPLARHENADSVDPRRDPCHSHNRDPQYH